MQLSDATPPSTSPAQQLPCSGCAGGVLKHDLVKTALWLGGELVVVEDIPALVCQRCGERYFEDDTAMALDMMRGQRDATGKQVRTLSVPVYTYVTPGQRGDTEGRS